MSTSVTSIVKLPRPWPVYDHNDQTTVRRATEQALIVTDQRLQDLEAAVRKLAIAAGITISL